MPVPSTGLVAKHTLLNIAGDQSKLITGPVKVSCKTKREKDKTANGANA
jgi:hypothetical protein